MNQKHTTNLVYSDSNDSYEPVLISESKTTTELVYSDSNDSYESVLISESETYHKPSVFRFKWLLWVSSY